MDDATLRFLCDEMLGDLARWLRAAGYDTELAHGGAPDAHWLRMARAQRRLLLTRDRRIVEHSAAEGVAVVLPTTGLDAAAARLRDTLRVDWLHAPFTRCLIDNAPLRPAGAARADALPPDVEASQARRCDRCGRLYWSGSHHARMRARLEGWASGTGRRG